MKGLSERISERIWRRQTTPEFRNLHEMKYKCVCGHYRGEHSGRTKPGYNENIVGCHYCDCPVFRPLGEVIE